MTPNQADDYRWAEVEAKAIRKLWATKTDRKGQWVVNHTSG